MPTPPPTTAAAPAAAPATPPAASPTPPAAAPVERHPAHASLMERLFSQVEEEPDGSPKPPAEPAEPAAPAAPATPAVPAAEVPPAPERPIRSRQPAAPKRPELPLAQPPAPAAQPLLQSDEDFEKGLVEGEQQMLSDARYAEKANPTKFKGLGDKVKSFIKAHTKYLEDHPDVEDDDPAYKKFLADNRPTMSARDVREIEEHRIAEQARRPVDERVNKLEHEIFVRDENPKIEKYGDDTYRQLAREALPAEILALVKQKGGLTKEVTDQFGEELDTAHDIFVVVADDMKEFQRLTTKHPGTQKPLVEFNPENEQHARLSQMVEDLCVDFREKGGASLQRNGKWFVTRDEWNKIDPARRGEFWTFTNKEITQRALAIVPNTVKETIRLKKEAMERRGYIRKPVAPAAPAAPVPPAPPGSPAIRPSPVPSGGGGGSQPVDASTKSLASKLLIAE